MVQSRSDAGFEATPLGRQILEQFGGRLKRARLSRHVSAVEMARQVGVSRTTLQAVESGKPSPSIGTYLRVMSALGLTADVALLATGESDILAPPPPQDLDRHGAQDYQSLLMHVEAVRLLKRRPGLVARATATLRRWRETADPRTHPLLDEWERILERRDWSLVVARTERGDQLRQASPLSTLLPDEKRLDIIRRVKALKERERGTPSA